MINKNKNFVYRITHLQNLPLILQHGILNKKHREASKNYIEIGNSEIIDVRSSTPVKIKGYGMVGDYVPFYFTPKSMMLYNILTGYRAPVVPKREKSEILVIRCLIEDLAALPQWFFTDGQGNDMATHHYRTLNDLDKIDWEAIQQSKFSKSDGDYDRPRRYQAEFLVHEMVPLESIESLHVSDHAAAGFATDLIKKHNLNLAVHIQPDYFF